jgi:hypothetical protein
VALSLVESVSLLGGIVIAGALLWLLLRPLRVDVTLRHEPPPEPDDEEG